jgi:hypothetical protein
MAAAVVLAKLAQLARIGEEDSAFFRSLAPSGSSGQGIG